MFAILRIGLMATLAGAALLPAAALAQDDDADEGIVVYGDLFSRWDNTRWYIATELSFIQSVMLSSDRNLDMRIDALQIRTILNCEKDWKLSNSKWEVHCTLEDIGIQASPRDFKKHPEKGMQVLNEIYGKLKGANLQLQVKKDGRVTNIQLEGISAPHKSQNRRTNQVNETLRMMLSRLVVGYDMKLRKFNFLQQGQWVEYNSPLLSFPSSTASAAGGVVIHQLDEYKGHMVVQTVGKGTIANYDNSDTGDTYKAELQGVSIYDEDEGFMVERVWYMRATPTADTYASEQGILNNDFFHAGRLRILEKEEKVDVGPVRLVALPGQGADILNGFPEWVSIETPILKKKK